MGLVDTKLVGHLGAHALAGVGFGLTLVYLAQSFVSGLMRGVKVHTAHAVGEAKRVHATGNDAAAEHATFAQAGVVLGFCAGLLILWAGRDVTWVLQALDVDVAIRPSARAFVAAITLGAPSACVQFAMVQYRQGLGDSRLPSRIMLAGNLLNLVLAFALVRGAGPLPAMGVRGAGYATAIVLTVNALLLCAFGLPRRLPPRGRRSGAWRAAVTKIARVGAPTGLQFALELGAFVVMTAIMGHMGSEQLAAHHIALMVLRSSFLPGVAVGEATSVLVGQALGHGRPAEARATVRAALALAISFMLACGAVFLVGGGSILGAFSDDPSVLPLAQRLLWLAAVFQVSDAVNIVMRGALRGAKDAATPAKIGIAVVWLTVPPAAYVLGYRLGLGVLGGWIGFLIESTAGAVLLGLRWRARFELPRGATTLPKQSPSILST
jgi:MATE family multidrug resistance protein